MAECGGHFRRATSELAVALTLDFLAHFDLIARDGERQPEEAPQRRFELLQTRVVQTPEWRFVRPLVGFEVFQRGELIATDGSDEIRAPCDDCTILMPTRKPIVGREGVYLSRPLA